MIPEVTDFLCAVRDSFFWAGRALLARLPRRKPDLLATIVSCSGCRQKPNLSFDDQRNAYHLTCVNPACTDPHWTSALTKNRDLKATIAEWFEKNQITRN